MMNRQGLVQAMWKAYGDAPTTSGRYSMERALDVCLKEVLPDPTECDYEKELDAVCASWNWDHIKQPQEPWRVKQMIRDAVCIFWTRTRTRYSAKSDPAVNDVRTRLIGAVRDEYNLDVLSRAIVAAVRAADKGTV